jgi:hypothetical protein
MYNISEITDEYMRKIIGEGKHYSIIILRHGPNWNKPGAEKIVWEHGRRNFALQKDGLQLLFAQSLTEVTFQA